MDAANCGLLCHRWALSGIGNVLLGESQRYAVESLFHASMEADIIGLVYRGVGEYPAVDSKR